MKVNPTLQQYEGTSLLIGERFEKLHVHQRMSILSVFGALQIEPSIVARVADFDSRKASREVTGCEFTLEFINGSKIEIAASTLKIPNQGEPSDVVIVCHCTGSKAEIGDPCEVTFHFAVPQPAGDLVFSWGRVYFEPAERHPILKPQVFLNSGTLLEEKNDFLESVKKVNGRLPEIFETLTLETAPEAFFQLAREMITK